MELSLGYFEVLVTLTSPTSGGPSVDVVRLRTKATESRNSSPVTE
jgi:hypothetical protein